MMIRIKDIEEYVEDNMLETIFREREDEIYKRTKKDKEEISKISAKYSVDYEKLIESVKNLPPHFNNIRENIISKLDEYNMKQSLIVAYDNEKFYKARILWWNQNDNRESSTQKIEVISYLKFKRRLSLVALKLYRNV